MLQNDSQNRSSGPFRGFIGLGSRRRRRKKRETIWRCRSSRMPHARHAPKWVSPWISKCPICSYGEPTMQYKLAGWLEDVLFSTSWFWPCWIDCPVHRENHPLNMHTCTLYRHCIGWTLLLSFQVCSPLERRREFLSTKSDAPMTRAADQLLLTSWHSDLMSASGNLSISASNK